ncbi:hypothetical protein TRFO_23167 [Tritrichomonas foetus]|uniref:Uncharacterized protein n=1 Tax=Tritrichomonas foetus TaxID=1144522 RepID=A0A1J4KGC6_9EUKA|nr:hypothetical protein TRFO_23167 [Tritrichomonas foetus]|eukprot:OHT08397.1 hypothetical protein TRFO_23167 [Tritrichomonas foetus]
MKKTAIKTPPNLLQINVKNLSKTTLAIPTENSPASTNALSNSSITRVSSQSSNLSTPRANTRSKSNFSSHLQTPSSARRSKNFNEEKFEKGIEKKELIFIKQHLKRTKELVTTLANYNQSSIITDSKLLSETENLSKYFLPFQREANEYFHQLDELHTPIIKIPIHNLKCAVFSFLQKWKEFIQIIDLIREDGHASLYNYISIKFRKVDLIIQDISSKNRKMSVHVETLEKRGGNLQSLLQNLNESIQQLLLGTDITKLDSSWMESYIHNIKSFLRLYNDTHYREFPKSGFMQVELAHFKSDVIAACNEAIEGLRAAFSLHSDLDKIAFEANEISSSLQLIINRLNLPTTLTREVPKEIPTRANSNNNSPGRSDLSEVEHYINEGNVCDPDKSIVACANLEAFLDGLESKLLIDRDREKTVWERLDIIQNEFFDRLRIANQKAKTFEKYHTEIANQGKEIATLMEESQEKTRAYDKMKRELTDQIDALKKKISDMENDSIKSMDVIDEKDKLISQLRTDNDNKRAKEAMNRIGQKMGAIMNGSEEQFDFEKDGSVQTVDKMSVFVLERRCQKCREYEQMRRDIRNLLKDIIGLREGETIIECISRLRDEVINLRETNVKLMDENEQLTNDMTELKKSAIEIIKTATKDMSRVPISFDDKKPKDISELAKTTFVDLRRHHQDELRKLEQDLREKHNADLFEISNMLNPMCLDSNISSPKTTNYKALVHEKIRRANTRFKETEEELEFSKKWLKIVEKWMNEQAEMTTEMMPIDQALEMLMDAIEHKPNPLEKVVNRLENQIYLINKAINQITKNIQRMTQKNDVDPDNMELFEMLNYSQIEINRLVIEVEENREALKNQSQLLAECRSTLTNIGKKMFHILMQDSSDLDTMKLDELMLQCLTAVEDVSNPKARLFIPIADLNQMTKRIRKNAKIPNSLDPLFYLPILDEKMGKYRKSFNLIEQLQPSLESIFRNFDFQIESMDPECRQFSIFREQIFHMQNILSQYDIERMIKSVNDVLQRFVTISASLISCIAHESFKALRASNKPPEPVIDEEPKVLFQDKPVYKRVQFRL